MSTALPIEYKFEKLCATKGLILTRSNVRTLVASSDWWASLNVVSVYKKCEKALFKTGDWF